MTDHPTTADASAAELSAAEPSAAEPSAAEPSAADPRAADPATAAAVLDAVNARHGTAYRVVGRFDGGRQGGAWRVTQADESAVLKWSDKPGLARRRAGQASMVARLRERGYPTPRWVASGVTDEGLAYVVEDLVAGEPCTWGILPLASVLAAFELQTGLGEPGPETWSTYVRWVVTRDEGPIGELRAAGAGEFVDHVVGVVAPHLGCDLPDDDLVHGDVNSCNVLVRSGGLAAFIDAEAVGSGTRAVDYGWLLREAYAVDAPEADKDLVRAAGVAVAGREVMLLCCAATALDIAAFELGRGDADGSALFNRLRALVDEL